VPPQSFQFVLACLTSRASSSPRWLTSLRPLGRTQAASGASKYLHSSRHDPFGLETELAIQFLERRRGAKGFHADDTASRTDITLPAKHRSLLNSETRLHRGQQNVIPIGLRLLFENVPRRHRDYAGSNPLSCQRFMGLNDHGNFAPRSDEVDLRSAISRIGHDICAARPAARGCLFETTD